ncbi:MAG: hypothetical protein Q4E39_02945 [bacterium]|nr:hypothetical protein [bacterium]
MEKKLHDFVYRKFSNYIGDKVFNKVLNDVLPKEEDISYVGVIAKDSIVTYKLSDDDLFILSINAKENSLTISSLNSEETLPTENIEKITIDNDQIIYNSMKQFRDYNGVIITGANSIIDLDRYGNVVPNKIHTGIWFYDKEFLENIGDTDSTIRFLSGTKNPVNTLTDLNICNYQIYRSLPDMYQEVCAWRNKNIVGNDNIGFISEIEMFNGNKHMSSFCYPLKDDFRDPIRRVYKSVIKDTGIEKNLISYSGLDNINTENLGVFDVHKNYDVKKFESGKILQKDK